MILIRACRLTSKLRFVKSCVRYFLPWLIDRLPKPRSAGLEQTTTSDFLICPHPRFNNLHLATPSRLEPPSTERICHSIHNRHVFAQKWSWESKKGDIGPYRFMVQGEAREIGSEQFRAYRTPLDVYDSS